MNRLTKLLFSALLLLFSGLFTFTHGDTLPYSPWAYRFFVHPDQLTDLTNGTMTREVVLNYQNAQPLWVAYVRVLQEMIGLHFVWIKIPAAAFIAVMVYAFLSILPTRARLLTTFVAVAGPLTAISYTFGLRKYLLNICIMLTVMSLIVILSRREETQYLPAVIVLASGVLWLNHYSFWPFFAVFAVVYLFLRGLRWRDYRKLGTATVLVMFPFVLYQRPALAYVSALTAFLGVAATFDFTDPIGSLAIISKGQAVNPANFDTFVAPATGVSPTWLPVVLHAAYVPPLLVLVGLWLIANFHPLPRTRVELVDRLRLDDTYRVLLLSLSVAFLTTAVLYLLIGYPFRIMTFWPMVLPVFGADLWRSWSARSTTPELSPNPSHGVSSLGWERSRRVFYTAVVVMAVIHMGPVFPYDYIGPEQPAKASVQQVSSSEFVSYIDGSEPLYTDLLHKSILVTEGIHYSALVGYGAQVDTERVGVNRKAAVLFEPSKLDQGYVLQTHDRTAGLIIRGATVSTPDPSENARSCNAIYSNGMDSLWTECTNEYAE